MFEKKTADLDKSILDPGIAASLEYIKIEY